MLNDIAQLIVSAFEFVDEGLTCGAEGVTSQRTLCGKAYWKMSSAQLRISKEIQRITTKNGGNMSREERRDALIAKREQLREANETAKVCGLADQGFYENEIELVAIMNAEELDQWAVDNIGILASLVKEIVGEPKRTLITICIFTMQSIGVGKVRVSSEPLPEDAPVEMVVDPGKEWLDKEKKVAEIAKTERRPLTDAPVDKAPDWDVVGLSLMKRSWSTCEKTAEAMRLHLGEKKGLTRFNDYAVNLQRLNDLEQRLTRGEVEGWMIKQRDGKHRAFQLKGEVV